jgi:type IV pilus assembly protein PilY1
MKSHYSRILCTIIGALALFSARPTFADDSEVFTSSSFTAGQGVRANVLFVIDTSGSMSSEVILYNPNTNYTPATGGCDATFIYWSSGNTSTPPPCTTTNKFALAQNRCRASYLGMQAEGWWAGTAAQLNSGNLAWGNITTNVTNRKIECQSDRANNLKHGDLDASNGGTSTSFYARSGSATSSRWTSNRNDELDWGQRQVYSFYTANYINWYNTAAAALPVGGQVIKTRLQIVKDVASSLITDLDGVNLGLMRYSNNGGCGRDDSDNEWEARGGMVTYPISELNDTTRTEMKAQINSWAASGWTPLSETLFEAYQYLSGGTVTFGANDHNPAIQGADYEDDCEADNNGDFGDRTAVHLFPSVAGSRAGGVANAATYDSPMDFSCQQTFVVYLTDGLPTQDTESNSTIPNLPNFAKDGRVPYILPTAANYNTAPAAACPTNGPSNNSDGRCMVNLAGYMHRHDLRPTDVVGLQNVTTYVVGFGSDIAESASYLSDIAAAGGGQSYTQGDAAGLKAALEEIFAQVRQNANTTFVSPTVAVNAFNRTRNLNTLFISVFAPTEKVHWPGNIKKYQLINGVVYGSNTGSPAVDTDTDGAGPDVATGFFAEGTTDLFNNTGAPDGPDVTKGGAASRMPDWNARNVYSFVSSNRDLSNANNRFEVNNSAIRYDMLGLANDTNRQAVIEFTLGLDNNDTDGDLNITESRKAMGDPMHSRPAVAIYGGTESAPVGTVYTTTNDGMLHALDMNTGAELWAFLPVEMMQRANTLMRNRTVSTRSYGIDGDVRVFKYDLNGNGIIETGDKMYVLFGFGRGGPTYYALDITNRTAPRYLWKKDSGDLPMLGQSWSTPQITRVNVGGTGQSDPQKFVAIFAAGYDTGQENFSYRQDTSGTGIYMLELSTGNVLWSGGRTGTAGVNWTSDLMTNSIPADISVIDLNGDTFGDRMYVGDMGGRIWRFDIWHGQAPDLLVSGGVLATLGVGHLNPTNPGDATVLRETRRFYNAADVSLVTPRGSAPYFNIAIGSGYRGHPLERDTRDRFYSIRDYRPFERRLDDTYSATAGWTPITDASLVDVTTDTSVVVPDGSTGWKILLNSDGWRGEKVLGEAVTVGGVIFFPTFTPIGTNATNPCLAATLNRTWAVYLDSARPFGMRDGQNPGTGGETGGWARDPRSRFTDNPLDGIAPGTAVIMSGGGSTANCPQGDCAVCLVGATSHKCPKVGGLTRTYWERRQ